MKPVAFKESNFVYAKDQPQYLPLPVQKTSDGLVTACWEFAIWERIVIMLTGKLWFAVRTFNQPLQPQKPSVMKPIFNNPGIHAQG